MGGGGCVVCGDCDGSGLVVVGGGGGGCVRWWLVGGGGWRVEVVGDVRWWCRMFMGNGWWMVDADKAR
jgi:hypothetical protein